MRCGRKSDQLLRGNRRHAMRGGPWSWHARRERTRRDRRWKRRDGGRTEEFVCIKHTTSTPQQSCSGDAGRVFGPGCLKRDGGMSVGHLPSKGEGFCHRRASVAGASYTNARDRRGRGGAGAGVVWRSDAANAIASADTLSTLEYLSFAGTGRPHSLGMAGTGAGAVRLRGCRGRRPWTKESSGPAMFPPRGCRTIGRCGLKT
mmetsp:Transcript_49325/g.122563  ORF Transcript_49325/g.122563 Transcript_49325/m.122563 type:complete len:203 (-) Transcript_49325:378-986(-)